MLWVKARHTNLQLFGQRRLLSGALNEILKTQFYTNLTNVRSVPIGTENISEGEMYLCVKSY
jgi:hypothetical protein